MPATSPSTSPLRGGPDRVTDSMKEATAKSHEKMARLYRELGRESDAQAADRAAQLCREGG